MRSSEIVDVNVLFSRAGIATNILVRLGRTFFLVDAGDGTLRDLLAKGVPPKSLTAILLTHGHSDHVAGLYGVLGYLRAEDFRGALAIVYPKGCCEVEALVEAFYKCYSDTIRFQIDRYVLVDKEEVQIGEIRVQAWQMRHWHSIAGKPLNPAPALGYRLIYSGHTIAITGDTAFFPELRDFIKGADIAVIEATLPEDTPGTSDFVHLTREQAQELANLAKRALFVHRTIFP